jgi:predicted RNA binding protein YcfA (HicA-like mRNA interferase family)
MSQWRSVKARQLPAALLRIGFSVKRPSGTSHRVLARPGWAEYIFAFHDREEIGPKMLARISKATGLQPEDL